MIAFDHAMIEQALKAPRALQQEQHIDLQLLGPTILIDGAVPVTLELDDTTFRITFVGASREPVTITRVQRQWRGEWIDDCMDFRTRQAAESAIAQHLAEEEERIRDERETAELLDRIDGTTEL